MDRNIRQIIKDGILIKLEETVWAYLKKTNAKSSNYDPYRNTGYTKTSQSPEPVKAQVKHIRGNSLVARELGLSQSGAIELVINSEDENIFRICDKVRYDDVFYSPFNKALGDRVQIYKLDFNLSKVILFRLK